MKFNFKVFLLSAIVAYQSYGQDNAITTVAPFLSIATDARSAGMGDVGVASSADANSIYHNGAKMVFNKNQASIAINYTPWLRNLTDDIYIGNITYQQKIDERSAFGGGIKYFNYGEVQITNSDGDSSTPSSNPYEFAIDAAYALKLSENYSMSVALRYTRSDLSITGTDLGFEESNGFGVDISGFFQSNEMGFSSFNGIARGGFAITNLGPKVEVFSREEFLPTTLKLGGGFDFIFDDYNRLAVNVEFAKLLVPSVDGDDKNFLSGAISSFGDAEGGFSEEMQEVTVGLGAEYLYNEAFAFRGGYYKEHEDKGGRNFYTLGLGFKASSFGVDLSYLKSNTDDLSGDPLENTLRISLTFDFGEIYE